MKVGVEVLVNATRHGQRVDQGSLRLNAKANGDPKAADENPKEAETNESKIEANEVEKSEPSEQKWKINDFCRAKYLEDDQVYEAQIIALEESAGHRYATVKFLGYGNDEHVWLENLMESLGEEVRNEQIQ